MSVAGRAVASHGVNDDGKFFSASAVERASQKIKDLYRDYQMVGSDRVEKRLRLLTIVSAITLPLGLLAGLLGMNVGGMPGTSTPAAFAIVATLMAVIALAQYWYFRSRGWFD